MKAFQNTGRGAHEQSELTCVSDASWFVSKTVKGVQIEKLDVRLYHVFQLCVIVDIPQTPNIFRRVCSNTLRTFHLEVHDFRLYQALVFSISPVYQTVYGCCSKALEGLHIERYDFECITRFDWCVWCVKCISRLRRIVEATCVTPIGTPGSVLNPLA